MPKINELFVFVMIDESGEHEGLMTMRVPNEIGDVWTPFVGADMKRVDSLRPMADKLATEAGKSYRILKFTPAGEI